jgi:hypothetical protein
MLISRKQSFEIWLLQCRIFNKIPVYQLHYFFPFSFFCCHESKSLIETSKKICIFEILTLDFSFWHTFAINKKKKKKKKTETDASVSVCAIATIHRKR